MKFTAVTKFGLGTWFNYSEPEYILRVGGHASHLSTRAGLSAGTWGSSTLELNTQLKTCFICYVFVFAHPAEDLPPAPTFTAQNSPSTSVTLLSPWQPAQPLAALLTRTNTTTTFCRLYKVPKGILLPSASTTKQWAASRISAGSRRGAADTGRTCCTTGHRGAPDMAAAPPFRPTFPRE